MSTKSYVLNFTDPTKSTITVPAGNSFGPNSATRFTDIELIGMGHTFWGEKINENILHMLENFASNEDLHPIDSVPSATTFVVAGKDVTKSFVNSGGSPANTIEIIGSNSNDGTYPVVSSTFDGINTTITIVGTLNTTIPLGSAGEEGVPDKSSDFSPVTAITGQLWYNQTSGNILVFSQNGSPLTAGVGDWKPLNEFTVSTTPPTGATDGNLWWDSSVVDGRNLKIYITGIWEIVVPDMLPRDGSKPMAGILDMGNNRITNVATTTSSADVMSRLEADGRYVNTIGDNMSGTLTMDPGPGNNINLNSNRIFFVGDPVVGTDGMSRAYADNRYINVTGDIMQGVLSLNNNRISSVANALAGSDALNWNTADGRYVNVTGDTMSGNLSMTGTSKLTLSSDPTNNLHAATKQYVDSSVGAGINAVGAPAVFSSSVVVASNWQAVNAWTTIAIGTGFANAQYVMIVADAYYVATSSGNSALRVFARDPLQSGVANSKWQFVYSGGNPIASTSPGYDGPFSAYLVGSGTTIVKTGAPTSNPTIEVLATTNSGNIASTVNYRIVAWW